MDTEPNNLATALADTNPPPRRRIAPYIAVAVAVILASVWGSRMYTARRYAADLQRAVITADKSLVETLLDEGDGVNARDPQGGTPLHWSVARGDAGITRLLMDRGADVKAGDDAGLTPLMVAASAGYARFVELLIQRGADVNATDDEFGFTPLHWAIDGHKGLSLDTIAVLILRGADLSAKDAKGRTPLAYAVEKKRTNIAAYLRDRSEKD